MYDFETYYGIEYIRLRHWEGVTSDHYAQFTSVNRQQSGVVNTTIGSAPLLTKGSIITQKPYRVGHDTFVGSGAPVTSIYGEVR